MPNSRIASLILALVLNFIGSLDAQILRDDFREPIERLETQPNSEAFANHYKALKLFAQGQIALRDDRLLEASRLLEAAHKLEPGALPIVKALVPLCLNLDREEQALHYSEKAIALASENPETLYRHGQLLRKLDRPEEALSFLYRGALLKTKENDPRTLLTMCFGLVSISEERSRSDIAIWALSNAAHILEHPDKLHGDVEPVLRDQVNQEAARVYEKLGKLYLDRKEPQKALAVLQRSIVKDPVRAGRVHAEMSEIYLSLGETEKGLEYLKKFVSTQPGGGESYEKLIRLLVKLNRETEILPTLQQALVRDRFNQSLKLVLARESCRLGKPIEADRLYRELLDESPSDTEAFSGWLKLCKAEGRWKDVLARVDRDLADPRRAGSMQPIIRLLSSDATDCQAFVKTARGLPREGAELDQKTRRVLALFGQSQRQFDHAEHFARLCLTDVGVDSLHEIYILLVRILEEGKKTEAKVEMLREAVSKKIRRKELFQAELARGLATLEKFEEAKQVAKSLVKETEEGSDEHYEATLTLCIVLYRAQELDEAQKICEQLLHRHSQPDRQRHLLYLLSGIAAHKKEHETSEKHLKKILELDPEDASANNDLGYLWADQNRDLTEAERMIRLAIEQDRKLRKQRQPAGENGAVEHANAAYLDSLGWVLYRQGKLREALEQLLKAAALPEGEDPVIWDHLGDVYRDLKQSDYAKRCWQRALELYGKSKRQGLDDKREALEMKLQELK